MQEIKTSKKISLFSITLYIMVFFYGIKQIELFSNNIIVNFLNQGVQAVGMFLLLYIIFNKKVNLKLFYKIIFCVIILLIGIFASGGIGWLRYFLLIIAARNRKFSEIIKTIFYAFMSVMLISVALYLLRMSGNKVYRRNGISLGFIHPNIAALIVITIIFLYIANKNVMKTNQVFLVLISAVFGFFVLKTRVTVIILLMFPIIYKIIVNSVKRKNKVVEGILCIFQLVMCVISYLMTVIYPLPIYDKFRTTIDMALSYRPYLNFNNISKYGVSLFGSNVTIYNNTDYAFNYFKSMVSNQKFNTVDNAYIMQLITVGIVPMILMFLCFFMVMKKAWKNKNYTVLAISVCFSIYGLIENGCNEAYYFFTFFYLLAIDDIVPKLESSALDIPQSKNNVESFI